jgi:hypothetical protein
MYPKDSKPYCLLVLFDRLCVNGTDLVLSMDTENPGDYYPKHKDHWTNVLRLKLAVRNFSVDPGSIAPRQQAVALAYKIAV